MTRSPGGARLMIGLAGTIVDEEFARTLRETGAHSVILFARNLIDANQIIELTTSIRALVSWPLVIAIDQEGGVVVRLEKGITVFPGNMALGHTHDPEIAKAVGVITAREMAACGIDLILAPVVDLHVEERNPIVGFRSFGRDRQLVSAMATALIAGFNVGDCSACLKHFPGLGLATIDPHIGLPTIKGEQSKLFDPHMAVFGDVLDHHQVTPPAVMTTHVLLPDIDPEKMATVSSSIVDGILRKQLGFEGCIVTDDLEMGGAGPLGSMASLVVDAALAGHDMMVICHRHDLQLEAARALEEALQNGVLDSDAHELSVSRIDVLHRRTNPLPPMLNLDEGAAVAAFVANHAIQFLRDPLGLKDDLPVQNWKVTGGREEQRAFLGSLLATGSEQQKVLHLVDRPDRADAGSQAIEKTWRNNKNNVLFVLLGSPSDISFVPEGAPVMTAYGRTNCQLTALAQLLGGPQD